MYNLITDICDNNRKYRLQRVNIKMNKKIDKILKINSKRIDTYRYIKNI